ncbi:NADPH-dependent FMN reductase [Levilactobacillus suantsaii]|uniref:NAD(P)H-dependent oxidoreductase n=1 Tax=Levilactobacillus suantsaii TaxID=2292255 RepID=A0A4Q0VFI2_9LACO|nr:NADPH-dependent FMN reductase [Levilactobacillus suantsaii]QMU08260.1 NAD(P)H-dependent oxidoreductase [Levilactobacillus suantsaii]RXI76555.1 NAD(P)H-dependent oxidoreductase [Levilactobacillus suantsaii]
MDKFVAMVGTNAKTSTNRTLLQYMKRHFADQAELQLMEITDLPLFNKPENSPIPPQVVTMATAIDDADGVIIATPEYDHSAPAALMNALEWLSHRVHPFVDKPVMIVGASYGSLGSSRAQAHLRQILDSPELRARIMPSSEYLLGHSLQAFDDKGNLTDAKDAKKLDGLFKDFLTFVKFSGELNNATGLNKKEAKDFDWSTLE